MSASWDGTSGAGNSAAAASVSWNDHITGNYCFVIANCSNFGSDPSGITCGGTAMTKLATSGAYTSGQAASLWGLSNPPTGTSVAMAISGAGFNVQGASLAYSNVSSVGTAVTASAANTSASISLSSASGHTGFCAMGSSQNSNTAGTFSSFGGFANEEVNINTGNLGWPVLMGDASGTSTINFTATAPFAAWGAIAVDITGTGGGGGGPDPTAGARLVTQIPNPQVGPTALRQSKRWPSPPGGTFSFPSTPFGPLINKLATGQNVNIQCLGDSTCAGFPLTNGGWTTQLALMLGQYFNATVKWWAYGSGTTGAQYSFQSTLFTGTGPSTITVFNGGINASTLANEETDIQTSQLLAIQNAPTQGGITFPSPDAVMLYDGFNDIGSVSPGIGNAAWISDVETYITQFLQPIYATTPIVICNQHTSFTGPYWNTTQEALFTALTGSPTPTQGNGTATTNPSLQSTIYKGVWALDTQQALNGYSNDQIYSGAGDPHPNQSGYNTIAQWMLSQLVPQIFGNWTGPWAAPAPFAIPNPFVGPAALRNKKRMPYVAPRMAAAVQALSDGANSTWVFTTSTNGRRGIADGANQTITFSTSTQGVRGVRDGANITLTFTRSTDGFMQSNQPVPPIRIPNPFVGPTAMRGRKRMPYYTYRTAAGPQSITDGANTTIIFSDSPAGVRGVHDGANITITVGRAAAGQRHIFDSANQTIVVNTSITARQGFHDGANLHLAFITSDDGFIHPFLVDITGKVIVGPNEIRSITLPAPILSAVLPAEIRNTIIRGLIQ